MRGGEMLSEDKKITNGVDFAERVDRAKVVRKVVTIALLAIVVLLITAMIIGYFYVKSALGPVDKNNEEVIEVTIPIGSSSSQIGRILADSGVIKNASFFKYYVRYKNETGFQAGDYQLSKAMSVDDILNKLKEGRVHQDPELIFTIPEGLWLVDIAETIAKNTEHKQEDIIAVLNDRDNVADYIESYPMLSEEILDAQIRYPLEGYLFPARYDFLEKDVSIETIIDAMLKQMNDIVSKMNKEGPAEKYSTHELLTLASIIEREAKTTEDRFLISGVLFNRLEKGMLLQVDPTVAYAIGEHRYMTSLTDLEVNSPYNTYKNKGIPPGPIASPGKESIEAAFSPAKTDALYFYARYNGEVIYSKTYEEHDRVHQKYRQEWIDAKKDEEKKAQ